MPTSRCRDDPGMASRRHARGRAPRPGTCVREGPGPHCSLPRVNSIGLRPRADDLVLEMTGSPCFVEAQNDNVDGGQCSN